MSSPVYFLVHLTFYLVRALRHFLLTCQYNFSPFSLIFSLTGATFTDPLTCSFLILSFFVNPHIHRSILISFMSSLFPWFFVVDHVCTPYSNASLINVLYIKSYNYRAMSMFACILRFTKTCITLSGEGVGLGH